MPKGVSKVISEALSLCLTASLQHLKQNRFCISPQIQSSHFPCHSLVTASNQTFNPKAATRDETDRVVLEDTVVANTGSVIDNTRGVSVATVVT